MNRSGKNTVLIVLVVLAAVGVLCFACCGGGFWFLLNTVENQAEAALNQNPVIQEHLGVVSECDLQLQATGQAGGQNTFVFEVTGTKGTGTVTAQLDGSLTQILAGTLRTRNGDEFDLLAEHDDLEPEGDADEDDP
ncbi:MAG: hypothetical protein WD069_03640 [Planctomycetales bacterium]